MRSLERPVLALVAVALVAIPLAHGVALVLRQLLPTPGALAALELTLVALGAVAVAALASARSSRSEAALLTGTVAGALGCAALGLGAAAPAAGLAALPLGLFAGWAVGRVVGMLPEDLEGAARRRPVAAGLWALLGLLAVLQAGRISTFLTDASFAPGPTIPGYFAEHMCLPAYLQAAELNAAGAENVYDPAHYPGLTRDAAPTTAIHGMEHWLEDPFQYPPTFLLVSEAALAVSSDYDTIRTGQFVFQALAFAALALALARWVGGAAGRRALFLLPLVWLAPATNFNFQYGQFHLLVLLLAVGGMLAVERGRDALGGTLLAAATLSKLFPGLLLVTLVAQRRWRALGWTAAAGTGLLALSFVVLGAQPWSAFFAEHLPRLADGSAFAFDQAWPELRTVLVAGNQSPLGLVEKLVELGFAGARDLAPVLSGGYLLGIALVAYVAGRRGGARSERAASWLALLSLGSMLSGGAWAEYITVSVLWMLTFVAVGGGRLARGVSVLSWSWFLLLPGSVPPVFWEGPGAIALSVVGFLFAVALSTRVALADGSRAREALARGVRLAPADLVLAGRLLEPVPVSPARQRLPRT